MKAPSLDENPFLADKLRLIMKLRKEGISDTRVLSAIENIPRELFIPDKYRGKAYHDTAIPIEREQTISQPTVVAWMTSALDVHDRCRVLEVGTGSGYQAAILSKLARRVYTVERHKELLKTAEDRFAKMNLTNITTRLGDGAKGWPEASPFDRIIVTAAAGTVPAGLLEQLAIGGVMVIPVGDLLGDQILLRLTRDKDGFSSQHLMHVRFVPLVEGKLP